MRTEPEEENGAVVFSPQACLDRLADVRRAQSMVLQDAEEKRVYVFMWGAARRRAASLIWAVDVDGDEGEGMSLAQCAR